MTPITRQPNRVLNELNRRRSRSDSAIQIEWGVRRCPELPDWALPRSDFDIASCSSDDDHERIELGDRRGYRRIRRQKLKVRRRWAQTAGPDAFEVPRFCKELTEHVRSIRDGPLDADGIREDEGFFATLTAPYEPPSPSRNHDLNQYDPGVRRAGCPPGLCTCVAEQCDDNDCSSDDDDPIHHPDEDYEVNHDLYTPSGKWEKAKHRSIDEWKTLMRIKVTPPLSLMLRKGVIAGDPIIYISRLWNTGNIPRWKGFFSELALFASSRHLRPLQGVVVPHIINVYIEPGFVNVAMEPPHNCFWMEASPDMPNVLKHRCVEAFEKLHARGVLHGDAELRHILISADAKVTIIDFKAAATCVPLENVGMEEVGLRRATEEEFRLEMRRVKFKLDYNGARERERGKLMRKKQGKLREEDVFGPPVDLHVLNFQWLEGCERRPTRFVVPGQTKEQVDLAVKRFLHKVGEMERQMNKKTPTTRGRRPVSAVNGKGPDLPEVPVASPRSGLKIKIPPLNVLRSPIRAPPGPTSLLPPIEIPRAVETTPKTSGSFAEPPPLAAERASLQSKPSIEGETDDKAVTHSAEGELAPLYPGFGRFPPVTTIETSLATTVTEPSNYDGDEPLLGVPSVDFPLVKRADGESDHSPGSGDRKDRNQDAVSQVTSTAPPSTQRSAGSAFPIMRTFADVARRAIQVFGRLAGQSQAQPRIDSPQQQRVLGLNQRKRRLSDSSSSESNEYEAGRKRKRLRRSTISNPSDPLRPTLTQIPRAWSLITTGQPRRTAKRKRESEETSKLVWATEQELRRKRCKPSELSDLSDASGSEVEDDETTGRTAGLGKTSTGSVADKTALLDTLSTTRRESAVQSDKTPTPIIVRDYAYIPHKVPKAPYVPHPPTENRMAAERAKHISLSNAIACLNAGLPYPMTENQQGKIVPDLAPSPYMFSVETFEEKQERKRRGREMGVKGVGRVQRSFGNLKRRVDARRTEASRELEERLLASWKDVGHRLKRKVTKVQFDLENLRGDVQCPSGDVNPGVLHRVVRSVKETRGILKRPPPIKVFNYQAPWEEDDDALSPKVGPEPERWDRSGGFGMFGVWVKDGRSKTEETFREECALRVYESQRTIESVDAEWQQEEDRMDEVRRKEAEDCLG